MNRKILSSYYHELTPPLIRKQIDKIFRDYPSWYFKGEYQNWDEARAASSGYDDQVILNKVLTAILKVKSGEVACEKDSVTFDTVQYSWPLLANLMWVAAKNNGTLSVLDFGGALGSTYYQNKKYLDTVPILSWNIVEQKNYVEAGKDKIAFESLRFYETIDQCVAENKINVAIFSGVLDFLENPYVILRKVLELNIKYIIIDRSVFLKKDFDFLSDKIVLQVVKPIIFPAKLPVRILSFLKMKEFLEDEWQMKIIEEFDAIGGEGEDWKFKGFLVSKD